MKEFYNRVALREHTDLPKAVHHAQAVISVLRDAVSRGEFEDVRSQLPAEYTHLFAEASRQPERAESRAG